MTGVKDVRLVTGPFAPGPLIEDLAARSADCGGMSAFVGSVRHDGAVTALELTHYEPLTLGGMNALADRVIARFDLGAITFVHRVGLMKPGDAIVLVAAAARHRRAAIEAVDCAMDHLKSDAWFWKRELRDDVWRWIEPTAQDHADRARWR